MSDVNEMMEGLAKCGEELQGIRHAETPSELASSSGSGHVEREKNMKQTKCSNRKCGWIGLESERRQVRLDDGWTALRCPRCDCDSFYSVKPGEKEKQKTGAQLIALERDRQIKIEGYKAEDDDGYNSDELLKAALAYTMHEVNDASYNQAAFDEWPWDAHTFKAGTDSIRNLTKAGALIAAEIDRQQRKASAQNADLSDRAGRGGRA